MSERRMDVERWEEERETDLVLDSKEVPLEPTEHLKGVEDYMKHHQSVSLLHRSRRLTDWEVCEVGATDRTP